MRYAVVRVMNFNPKWLLALLVFLTGADGAEIYARKMEIVRLGMSQMTVLRESVAITDRGTIIVSRNAQLAPGRERAVLWDSVRIYTPEVDVQADSIEYEFPQRRSRIFARPGRVITLRHDSVEIVAPILDYFFDDDLIQAPAGLEVIGPRENFLLYGRRGGYFLNARQGRVDSEPVLRINPGTGNEVEITALCMEYAEYEGRLRAAGGVRVRSGTGVLSCDTAFFFPGGDSGVGWGNTEIRDSAGVAEGERLIFYLQERLLRRLVLTGRAQGQYRTGTGETVLVSGSQLSIELAGGKINVVEVADLSSGQLIRSKFRERRD